MRPRARQWVIVALSLTLLAGNCFGANKKADDAANQAGSAAKTFPLKTATNVSDCIAVEAALLPRRPASQLFGGWVASNFASVRVNISNHCKDQQFILHDVYFDYSHWALSGLLSSQSPSGSASVAGAMKPESAATEKGAASSGADEGTQSTIPGQIPSVGAKEIHDELKEASYFSPRNLVVNALVLVGTAASGYSFLVTTDTAKGIAAYGNDFVPGLEKFWPDRRPDQQSQVLLYGFQTNKVVAKQSADFVYAFFPIDRFLTPGLKSLFLKTPAAFFNPAEIFIDPKPRSFGPFRDRVMSLFSNGTTNNSVLAALNNACVPKASAGGDAAQPVCDDNTEAIKATMAALSLNSVHVVVRGIMTVDVNSVPCTIDKVSFDKEKDSATWTVPKPAEGKEPKPNQLTGTIEGKFLAGCTPQIVDISVSGVKDAKLSDYVADNSLEAVTAKATDSSLPFKLELKASLKDGSVLTFQVSRKSKDVDSDSAAKTESNKFPYTVNTGTPSAPAISDLTMDNQETKDVWQTPGKLDGTVTGSNLENTKLSVTKLEIGGAAVTADEYIDKVAEIPGTSTATKLDFQLTLLKPVAASSKVTFSVAAPGGEKGQTAEKEYSVPAAKEAAKPGDAEKSKPPANAGKGKKPAAAGKGRQAAPQGVAR
jgi:hypothetical protein